LSLETMHFVMASSNEDTINARLLTASAFFLLLSAGRGLPHRRDALGVTRGSIFFARRWIAGSSPAMTVSRIVSVGWMTLL
jgi:hypothetical protein